MTLRNKLKTQKIQLEGLNRLHIIVFFFFSPPFFTRLRKSAQMTRRRGASHSPLHTPLYTHTHPSAAHLSLAAPTLTITAAAFHDPDEKVLGVWQHQLPSSHPFLISTSSLHFPPPFLSSYSSHPLSFSHFGRLGLFFGGAVEEEGL